MLPSDKLFIDQLKTSDDVHIEQAPIDDKKRRNMPGISKVQAKEIILLHSKITALYEDDNDVHHCSNSWTSSSSQCLKYCGNGAILNRSWYMDVHERKKLDHDIDIETNRFSSTTLHLSKMTLFVYLFKDKLKHMN